MEVGGGDLGGGEGEGRVGAICFYFPQPLAFFWVFPSQFPNKGKNAQIQETKGRRHDPILTCPECGHKAGGPNGGGWGGGFSFGWMDIGAKKKI